MILVVGATGFLGGLVVQMLLAKGQRVRALVRTASDARRVALLGEAGAELVVGDLKDRNSIQRACSGVETVVTTASAVVSRQLEDTLENVDGEGTLSLCRAAERAGARQLIYVSFQPHGIEFPLQTAKRAVEAGLRAGSLPYTILQPTFFSETWLGQALWPACGVDVVKHEARVLGTGRNKNAWVSVQDVARVLVGCVNNPLALGQTLELGGPEPLDWLSVVRMFERHAQASFRVEHTPEAELSANLQEAADSYQKTFAALTLSCCLGYEPDNSRTLAAVPLELSSVEDYVRQTMRHLSKI